MENGEDFKLLFMRLEMANKTLIYIGTCLNDHSPTRVAFADKLTVFSPGLRTTFSAMTLFEKLFRTVTRNPIRLVSIGEFTGNGLTSW